MERRASEIAKSATKASATRENASHNGPSAGTATRMNANEPPQTAASNSSRAASPGAIDSVGGGVCPRAAAGLGDPECELATAGVGALVLEQPLLAPQPAAVPGQRAVGADHAVAGHDEAQAVVAVGSSDRAHRGPATDRRCDIGVGARRTGRNGKKRIPYRALKGRAAERDRRGKAELAAGKVRRELVADLREVSVRAGQNRALELLLHDLDFALEAPPVHEFEQCEAAVISERKHRAERSLEPLRVETFDIMSAA